jgi:outer membrane protein assembly factor BamD
VKWKWRPPRPRRVARTAALLALPLVLVSCAGGMPKVPATPAAVLERADEYLERGKTMQAIALYQQFLERYVGHERADYAQFKLAESHLRGREFAVAAVEYQVLITNYGYSEWVDDALFQIGVCYWREAPRPSRDQQKASDALSRFNQFLQIYPDSPRVPEARDYVRQINTRLAEKALEAARWYYRRHEPKAALIYCDKIIEGYPDNRYWVDALYLKGLILIDRGQNEEAIAQFTRVLEYPEDHPLKDDAQARIKEARP